MSLVVLDFLLSEQFEFVKLLEQSRGVLFRVWIVNHGVEEVCHGNIETIRDQVRTACVYILTIQRGPCLQIELSRCRSDQ